MEAAMRKNAFITRVLLAGLPACFLSACTDLQNGGQKATKDFKESLHATAMKVQELMTYHPPAPPEIKAIPPSYCYRVMQDILCYRDPRPGAEGRLVAYQGEVGAEPAPQAFAADMPVMAVETVQPAAPEAPPAMMPLAVGSSAPAAAPAQPEKTAKSMQHFAASKPVFIGAGPAVKASSEPLPETPEK